jgi:hypothetical protein
MALDKQQKNLGALLIGTGEFSFAEGAASVVAALAIGFVDFGNLTAFGVQTKNTTKEHLGSYRGVRRIDRTFILQTQLGYQLTSDEWDTNKLRFAFYGDQGTNYAQVIRTAAAVDALTTPAKNRWYDLLISGAHVRRLTSVAIVMGSGTVVEDTDYVIDYELGRIRWITTPTAITSISVTAAAILVTAADTLKSISPLVTPIRRGLGRLTCWDQNVTSGASSVVFDHQDFYCEVYVEGDATVDGQKESELKIHVNVLPPVGTICVREG